MIDAREQQLAESIDVVFFLMIFLDFTVHVWGICWLQLAFLAGLQANLGRIIGLQWLKLRIQLLQNRIAMGQMPLWCTNVGLRQIIRYKTHLDCRIRRAADRP